MSSESSRELLGERGDRPRAARRTPRAPRRPPARRRRRRRCARELLEVERVAARLLVERVGPRVPPARRAARGGLVARQRGRARGGSRRPGARRARRAAGQALGQLPRAGRPARAGRAASGGRRSSAREQLDRRGVGPVDVVERRARAAGAPRAARAARARPGARGSARPAAPAPPSAARSASDGRTCASSTRDVVAKRREPSCGSRPATYSSSASTKTQNGRSRSSSDALPVSTVHPRASARAASSASSRVLPIPGSPSTTRHAASPSRMTPSASSTPAISAARPTR